MSPASTVIPRPDDGAAAASPRPWKVLVVDDDEGVLAVTRLALREMKFDGALLALYCAGSLASAEELMAQVPEMDVVLLDVVMDTDDAGLRFVRYVRDTLRNSITRIILRTGQPGLVSPLELMANHEVDGYCTKADLTSLNLKLVVMTALRAARQIRELSAAVAARNARP